MRITHISARNSLDASFAWGAYSLVATLFLTIKHLGNDQSCAAIFSANGQPHSIAGTARRNPYLLALGLAAVGGLDLLAALAGLLFHRVRLMPQIEWWRPDRSPSWLGVVAGSSHHLAGVAYGAVGFLLLALTPKGRLQPFIHALLAAICFAALAGTSSYLEICFVLAVSLLALSHIIRRQWYMLALIAVCAVVAFVLAAPFLRELTTHAGYSSVLASQSAAQATLGNSLLKVVVRNWHFSYGVVGFYAKMWQLPFLQNPLRYIFPLLLLPVFFIFELTFYVFVIWYQFKSDFLSGERVERRALMLWFLFIGFALPGLLLSSAPTQNVNDFGMHTGLALRLVLIVWAAPMMANTWQVLRDGATPTPLGRWAVWLTLAALAVGAGTQLWQITLERIYMPLVDHGVVNTRLSDKGTPFLAIRDASEAAAQHLADTAILQSNPEGRWQLIFLLYTQRQMAAGDAGCESAFGGSFADCRAVLMPPLHGLFGGSGLEPRYLSDLEKEEPPADPAQMSAARFAAACSELHLSALLAAREDPVWQVRDSWVWTEPALYAGDSVRVIRCPSR
jgi:hypothetical protein